MAFQVLHLLLSFIFSDQYFWFSHPPFHVCSFKVQTAKRFVFPNAMQARRWWILNPQKKMIELNFAISNKFAKTSRLYIQWWKHTREENNWNTREESSSTLNDANNKHFEQLTMPVDARSHRYCQNYNLNHFLSNKRIWIRYHLCWSLFIVVQPQAPSESKANFEKEFVKKPTFKCFDLVLNRTQTVCHLT